MTNNPRINETLECPITGERMTNPYIDYEGNSYEYSAILDWLSRNETSPITRSRLRVDQLSPNRALRNLLEAQQDYGGTTNAVATAPTEDMNIESHQPLLAATAPKFDIDLTAKYSNNVGLVQVSVTDDNTLTHSPSSVVCVIDVSYSMEAAATMHDDSEGNAGLSLLDIVKHATLTVIETLHEYDKLAIVAYADQARVVVPFLEMTHDNRSKAKDAVNALRVCGSTNLYDGLLKAMELVKLENSAKSDIILLTDGQPNIHPPRGEMTTLKRYLKSNPSLNCQISTFGFGYTLDSKLLYDIAVESGGHYCFIPDSSFVGTVFINLISNILSAATTESILTIKPADGVKIKKILNHGLKKVSTSMGLNVQLPPLLYGQTFDILLQFENGINYSTCPFTAAVSVESAGLSSDAIIKESSASPVMDASSTEGLKIDTAMARCNIVDLIIKCEEHCATSKKTSRTRETVLNKARASVMHTLESTFNEQKDSESLKSLKADLTGQITEAYSRLDWHERWGKHYLLSLSRSHQLQKASNFKDPGLQLYATEKFDLFRDTAEGIFIKLPPPTPSLVGQTASANYRPVQSMSRYHNSNAPCFAAGSVKLADGRFISVSRVKPGHCVFVTQTRTAKVRCVVATACDGGVNDLVLLEGGVLVTPWHPVRPVNSSALATASVNKGWTFPEDLGTIKTYKCDFVYSFVLDDGSPHMRIGPWDAVTLGHGIEDDPVATHEYLGTDRVIKDLSCMKGWADGLVVLNSNPAVRDPNTGLIVAFKQEPMEKKKVQDEPLLSVSPYYHSVSL